MKRIAIFSVIILMLFTFCSCTGKDSDTSNTAGTSGKSEVESVDKEQSSESDEKSAASSEEDIDDGDSVTEVTDSKDGVLDYLVMDAWQEFREENSPMKKPEDGKAPPDDMPGSESKKDKWYFNSSLWFERDNTARLTLMDGEIDCTYRINDDFTISLIIPGGNAVSDEEKTIDFSLVNSSKYGIILSSKNGGERIRYYAARI